jgi:hypothetical protein
MTDRRENHGRLEDTTQAEDGDGLVIADTEDDDQWLKSDLCCEVER